MIDRRSRKLSQYATSLVYDLHRHADQIRKSDVAYRPRAAPLNRLGLRDVERPIHVGTQIEAVPTDDGWAA